MRIEFATRRLQRQLTTPHEIAKAYGDRAKRLMMRLDLLRAADTLADVPAAPPSRRHELEGNHEGCFAVDITGNWRLVFRPDHDPVATLEDGGVDLSAITAVVIEAIEDYH